MSRFLITFALVTVMLLAGLPALVSAADIFLEPMPDTLKVATQGASQDDKFFSTVAPIMKSFSNGTVPIGSQRMKVYSAYMSIRDLPVSVDRYDEAKANLAVLYYSVKAGEAYEAFRAEKQSVAAMTDGSEYYELAQIYYTTVSNWWALIADQYPKVTLYKIPYQSDPFPDEDVGIGTVLEGLKYPVLMTQREPDSLKPYQDEEVQTTISRWIEDNIDAIPVNESERDGRSKGYYFLIGDEVLHAKSTYIALSAKNVKPEFYDTASYIGAFLYFISMSREYYNDYLTDRTNIISVSDGGPAHDKSKRYYDEAQVALNLFRDKVPGVKGTTVLPKFPELDELPLGPQLDSEGTLHDYWGGTYW